MAFYNHSPKLSSQASLFKVPTFLLLPQTLTRPMASQQPTPAKRPFCPRCTKPLRLCLCRRLKSPPLDNPIGITILQHSLEKNHPLNSTRVARIGFKNLTVVPVTDVIFTARFTLHPVGFASGGGERFDFSSAHFDFDANSEQKLDESAKSSDFSQTHLVDLDERCDDDGCLNGERGNGSLLKHLQSHQNSSKKLKSTKVQADCIRDGAEAIFDKYRVTVSSSGVGVAIERNVKPDIGWILDTPIGRDFASNGFRVSKSQRRQLPASQESEDFEEFSIVMPPNAALLFPCGKSTIGLNEVDFEVKHLVVLDGTWAKAQRMYHENPWLKLLPHVKLDPGKESLYSDVRHQPKAGCLSTIESIVCAFKGLGHEMEGLDELLDVFESMIGDQRRCKEERFRARAMS